MVKEFELALTPEEYAAGELRYRVAQHLKVNIQELHACSVIKRSIDARARQVLYRLKIAAFINEDAPLVAPYSPYPSVHNAPPVAVVGMGPAGMFAALRLMQLGFKPVIFERGKNVRERRRDLRAIMQQHLVHPHSNYCFGEGGAGTYSDGKLYTRSTKRGNVNSILETLVRHGAHQDILVDAHPHIGSNKLPQVVTALRQSILAGGGMVHFNSQVTSLLTSSRGIEGVVVNGTEEYRSVAVVLATGHSARDVFTMLAELGIAIEAKPFAMGVRIEHPQQLIDEIQYRRAQRGPYLPPAAYNAVCQAGERGVFSFCMCPGGIIVPASTSPGELVLNGMSVSRRDSPFANSGFVVEVTEQDLHPFSQYGVFAGVEYQKQLEHAAWEAGGKTQAAPAQRVTDFLEKKISASLPKGSYIPGTTAADLHVVLPGQIAARLAMALKEFERKMPGYITAEAQLLAAETRTSSPIRVPRLADTLMHTGVNGLFPAGEGAGYAGGIVSAAIDGERAASAAAAYLAKTYTANRL